MVRRALESPGHHPCRATPTVCYQTVGAEESEDVRTVPTTQTAGKHQQLPWEQSRWAAAWGWWAASSWPALNLLQIHPPQLEKPPEDPAHLLPSCLGCIWALPDRDPELLCLHCTPLAAEAEVRKCDPGCAGCCKPDLALLCNPHKDKIPSSPGENVRIFSEKTRALNLSWQLF